jgi:hypothetical protein
VRAVPFHPSTIHLTLFLLSKTHTSSSQATVYQRYPRVHEFDCFAQVFGGGKGPRLDDAHAPPAWPVPAPAPPPAGSRRSKKAWTAADDPPPDLSVQLPDLTQGGWVFNGTVTLADMPPRAASMADGPGGAPWPVAGAHSHRRPKPPPSPPPPPHPPTRAHAWVRAFTADAGYGSYDAVYTLYVSADGSNTPLRLVALGQNLWSDGHFDLTVAEVTGWDPAPAFEGGADGSSTFAVPPDCPVEPGPSGEGAPGGARRPRVGGLPLPTPASLLASALPNPHAGASPAYDAWLHAAPHRRTRTVGEYAARAAAFDAAAKKVQAHNARRDVSYTLGLNHFADWLGHELPGAWVSEEEEGGDEGGDFASPPPPPSPRPGDAWHAPLLPPSALPPSVDWRGSPADSPVKDQAMCGSCWAFGTIGALETAVWRASGKAVLLSEQQLVDCAWSPKSYDGKYPNTGCFGGFQTTAYDWLFAKGGASSEAAYPYRGVNGFCDAAAPEAVTWAKAKYVWVGGGDEGLKEALVTKGPMTVSVDAAADDFALYKAGIYNNTACHRKLKRLDHAVLISGYGRDEESGALFWRVKNTWSRRWGEGGYIRIAAEPAGCGITAQPLYVELEGVKVAE